MNEFPHLRADACAMLALTDEDRINAMLNDQWIGYPRARQILDRMEELFNHPRVLRPPNLLVIGRTNNGKTQILKRFRKLHPASDNIGEDAINVPVVYVQAPPVPDEKRLYADILNVIFSKYSVSDHPHKLFANLKNKFQTIGVRLLIIDELNSLVSGSMTKQRQFLTVLKHMSNELQIPMVGAGTEDAMRALQTDPQLSNRFTPMNLSRWGMTVEFRKLLASCEQMLPLRYPSNLSEKGIAHEIWSRSEGTIGETVTLLREAAKQAMRTGQEKIDLKMLDTCGFDAPSARKKRLAEV